MSKIKWIVTLLILNTGLQAANTKNNNEFEIILPPAPDQVLNDTTIHGIDSNKNGVRDDIEIYIFKHVSQDWNVFNAYLQFFKNEHDIVKSFNEKEKFYELTERVSDNISSCILAFDSKVKFGAYARSRLFYNTKARKELGEKISNSMRSGIVIKSDNANNPKKNCKFKVKE